MFLLAKGVISVLIATFGIGIYYWGSAMLTCVVKNGIRVMHYLASENNISSC